MTRLVALLLALPVIVPGLAAAAVITEGTSRDLLEGFGGMTLEVTSIVLPSCDCEEDLTPGIEPLLAGDGRPLSPPLAPLRYKATAAKITFGADAFGTHAFGTDGGVGPGLGVPAFSSRAMLAPVAPMTTTVLASSQAMTSRAMMAASREEPAAKASLSPASLSPVSLVPVPPAGLLLAGVLVPALARRAARIRALRSGAPATS